jgi:phosphohistidine phosphatase
MATRNADVKTLYLVRHAKSSWADATLADHERPLNKRGLRDAPTMGQRLAEKKVKVDAMWVSPALRAVETARLLAQAVNISKKSVEIHDRLYSSSIDDLLFEIGSCSEKVKSLLIVGHNPVLTELADFLIDKRQAAEIMAIPTCGIVALEFSGSSWQQIKKNEGRFLFFDYPKKERN